MDLLFESALPAADTAAFKLFCDRRVYPSMANFMADMRSVADRVGLSRVCSVLWSGICIVGTGVGDGYRNAKVIIFQRLSGAWLIGPFVISIPKETLTFTMQATRKAVETARQR